MSPRQPAAVLAAAIALVLGAGGGSAIPQDRIVIRGARSGTHLRLEVRHGRLLVDGHMGRHVSNGCHHTSRRSVAVCRLGHVGSIEVDTGPSGDMVEVLKRLPVPLTVYLGRGSDKFIGNGERDTCYPQGTRRNRCVGGPGNDICVTGPRNTDCVGGSGNDYCKASSGSDGCWGGPGRDICLMGSGHDGCHGEGGDDRLYGGSGFDYCDGGRGRGRSQGCEAGPRH